jgi:TolB-like protein
VVALSVGLALCSTNVFAETHRPKILVLAFPTIGNGNSAWVSQSVQQSLQADLRNASVSHAAAVEMDDAAAIARVAKNAAVDDVVKGHLQVVGDQIRLTASLCDSAGAVIGTAKATGTLDHLFDLEDSLADQLGDAVAKEVAAKRVATTPIPVVDAVGPLVVTPAKAVPIGTVPVAYGSEAIRDGRDRYIYQAPYFGGYGSGFGACGIGFGFGGWGGGVFNGSYSTGGGHSLAW